MHDSFKHKGMRKQLISKLQEDKRIENIKIFDAFEKVPRHFFLDLAFTEQAYSNMAFQIGAGQTISHPITVAFQTELLDLKHGDKVLEIGTGSGFQTCILFCLGASVYSIERQRELHVKSQPLIQNIVTRIKDDRIKNFQEEKRKINSNNDLKSEEKKQRISKIELEFRQKTPMPRLFLGDGYLGSPNNAPFDKVIVTCGAPEIPQALLDQLKVGGIMVIPIGEGSEQLMKRITKTSETDYRIDEFGTFKFVPMLENIAK